MKEKLQEHGEHRGSLEYRQRKQKMISLYYYEELTMKEIGEVLGITESRVSQIHSKAVCRLRSKLKIVIAEEM